MMKSLVFVALVLLALLSMSSSVSGQRDGICGVRSRGNFLYDFTSAIGNFSVDFVTNSLRRPSTFVPDGEQYLFNLCGLTSGCGSAPNADQYIGCQISPNGNIYPLGFRESLRFSFVDFLRPQLGIVAETTQTPAPLNDQCYRTLKILFTCGPDLRIGSRTDTPYSSLVTYVTGSSNVLTCQYNFVVPTPLLCQNAGGL